MEIIPECYNCGAPATTVEHVPPAGIFPQPRPDNLITVPSCDPCNQAHKLDDEYFRVAVALGSNDSFSSMQILRGRIIPRLRKSPALGRRILKTVHRINLYGPNAEILKSGATFSFEQRRIQVVIERIVKGLFYKHMGQRLPPTCAVGEYIYNPELTLDRIKRLIQFPLTLVGDGSVFHYFYEEGASFGETGWYLIFYDASLFITDTTRSATAPPLSSSEPSAA